MSVQFAPVLQDLAAQVAGGAPARTAAQQRAYALRDVAALVDPDWVVTHRDDALEADTVGSLGPDEDVWDHDLTERSPLRDLLTLTEILAGLFDRVIVAASVTGPGRLARVLGERAVTLDDEPLAACGDVAAEVAAAHVAAGAERILVWEDDAPPDGSVLEAAHRPLLKRLHLLGVPTVLCGGAGLVVDGYASHADGRTDRRATLLPASALSGPDFGSCWADAVKRICHDGVVLTDGAAIPGELAYLHAASRRQR